MSIHVNMHRPAKCTVNSGPGFGCSLTFADDEGREISLYLPHEKTEAARCIAEYFNDNIAPPPPPDGYDPAIGF